LNLTVTAAMLENPKLLTLEQAVAARAKLRAAGKSLVLTNGVFDLLHTGHLYYLKEARRLGEALYVAINSDASVKALKGPLRPIQTEEQRAYALGALWFVKALRPDVYCKAGDYTLEKLDTGERGALQACRAKIEFLPFLPGFSTTALIARIKAAGEV
jgi:D-glycero-beta-D-manno-heptose 1-phosphate adenylyltransferase